MQDGSEKAREIIERTKSMARSPRTASGRGGRGNRRTSSNAARGSGASSGSPSRRQLHAAIANPNYGTTSTGARGACARSSEQPTCPPVPSANKPADRIDQHMTVTAVFCLSMPSEMTAEFLSQQNRESYFSRRSSVSFRTKIFHDFLPTFGMRYLDNQSSDR